MSSVSAAVSTACPICGQESRALFEKHTYWIHECGQCHHRFAPVEPTPEHAAQIYDDDYFHSGGAGYPDYLGEADMLIAHGRRYGKLLRSYMQPGTVLDVGAAAGFVLKGLTETGWQGTGIDPNPSMVHHARDVLGLDAAVGTLEDFQTPRTFDLVSMVQVVAHFYDLRKAFARAAALTKPSGYWLIETWNKDSFVARALGENWHEYSPPSVLHWFSPDSLHDAVVPLGFRRVAQGRPEKWLNGAHAKSLVQYKLEGSPLRALLNLIPDGLPIPYPTFDLFWAIYQKAPTP
ncbi:MAG: class I SAM-dependent methyltransferase [Anaerolineae bacterium]|nr:class I SAM-dependent methyltransferase [Anaerolineae bacterium]